MTSSPAHPETRPRRRRAVRRWTFIVLVLFIAAGTVAYFALLSPARMKQLAADTLGGKLGGEVTVGDAQFSLRSCQLVLRDVRLDMRGVASPASRLLAADRVFVQLDRRALWKRAQFVPQKIIVDRPTLTLAEVAGTKRMNYHFLSWEDAGDSEPDRPMPQIELRHGKLLNCEWSGGDMVVRASTSISGSLKALEEHPTIYRLVVYESLGAGDRPESERPDGVRIVGRLDEETKTIVARVDRLEFERPDNERIVEFLPSGVRGLWKDLAPRGTISRVTYRMDQAQEWETIIHVDGMAFNLPMRHEHEQEQEFKPVRMEGVRGVLRLSESGIEIIHDEVAAEELRRQIENPDPDGGPADSAALRRRLAEAEKTQITGTIEGMAHSLSGRYDGWSPKSPFNLSLVTEAFDLPEQTSVIYALPDPVQRAFRMIAPSGRLSVTMAMWRNEADGELDYLGTAKLLTGKGRFEKFPYELFDCRGTIGFNREQIKIRNITGRTSGDGSATIHGRITLPRAVRAAADDDGDGFYPGLDLTITAIDLPFDDKLYDAFKERYQPAIDMFFDHAAYDRLRQHKLIVDYETYNQAELAATRIRRELFGLDAEKDKAKVAALMGRLADINHKLDTPAFELGGRANVSVHVQREPGPDHHSQTTTDIDIAEAHFLFKYFPYPMHATGGRIVIRPGYVEFEDIKLQGLLMKKDQAHFIGGQGSVKGYVALEGSPEGDGHLRPNVSFTGLDLPMVDLLYHALPEAHGQWLRKLKLSGKVDVVGRVFADQDHQTDLSMVVTPTGLRASPGDGSLPLTVGQGEVGVTLKTLELRDIKATHPHGELALTGAFDWTNPDKPAAEIEGKVDGLDLSAPPFGAIRELVSIDDDWSAFLKEHQVKGRFDTEFRYVHLGADHDFSLKLDPGPIAFRHSGRPVKLTGMLGEVTADKLGLHLDGFGGEFNGGRFTTTGTIRFDDTRNARLAFHCAGDRVTDELKHILPRAVGDLIDTLQLDGKYTMDFDELAVRNADGRGDAASHVKGTVKLEQGRCQLGLDVTDFHGTFEVDVRTAPDRRWPKFNVAMKGERLRIGGRQVTGMTGALKSVDHTDHLIVPRLRGRMYGGAIAGSGGFDLSDKAYQMRFEMSDVDLEQFVKAGRPPNGNAKPADDKHKMKGRLSAALDLQGKWTDANGPMARGDVLVKDGEMYDLPLSVGLLQITNLSLPLTSAFQRAEVSYFIKDAKVVFERIALDSYAEVGDDQYISNLAVRGKGHMDYKTQALDLVLNTSNPGGLNLGALSDLIDGFKNQLVTIHVTGTLDQPKTEVRQLSALTAAWNDVFNNDE